MNKNGAFSLRYTYTVNDAISLLLETDIQGIAAFGKENTDPDKGYKVLTIQIGTTTHGGNRYMQVSTLLGGTIVDTSDFPIGNTTNPALDVWIYIHDVAISVYCNNRWVYSYVMALTKYADYTTVADLKALGGAVTLTNIRREEIPDWRDAVYVDYETTGDNALQSIYQQRPVWIFPETDRAIAFTYHTIKDTVAANHVWSYDNKQVNNNDISSDGLVYYYDVGISTYALAAEQVGFITRLYQLSELDIGAVEATHTIQEIALEHRTPITAQMRLDPRPEISDLMHFDLIVAGTKTHITEDAIIEDIQISLENGSFSMTMNGRKNLA
jgi:hypothetical protein